MTRTMLLLALCAGLLAPSMPAAAAPLPVPGQAQDQEAEPSGERVDLNTATAAELEALPGIGPRTAELIIEYREEQGPFTKVEDLMNIRGIGERTFLRLRPLIHAGDDEPAGP